MNLPATEENLESFKCQRCNECCRQPGFVYLRKDEDLKIANYLNLGDREFVDRYCELLDRRKLVLKKELDESCVFLGSDGCRIHEVKPAQCREFPFMWRTPRSFQYCEGLKKIGVSHD